MINQTMVNDMYNSNTDGMIHIKNAISKADLKVLNDEIVKNKDKFEPKIEKFIDNNQDVALIYRGDFNLNSLDNSVFKDLFKQYIKIRETISGFSDIAFEQGNVLEAKIIRYPVSNLGVDTHRDLSSNINLITFFNLSGQTQFYTYDDKEKNGRKQYHMQAGDISLMRGPRIPSEIDMRPLHGVETVKTERIVLAIREINTSTEQLVNKDNWMGF